MKIDFKKLIIIVLSLQYLFFDIAFANDRSALKHELMQISKLLSQLASTQGTNSASTSAPSAQPILAPLLLTPPAKIMRCEVTTASIESVLPLNLHQSALSADDLVHHVAQKLMSVPEFQFIRKTAEDLGLKVWLFGGVTFKEEDLLAELDMLTEENENLSTQQSVQLPLVRQQSAASIESIDADEASLKKLIKSMEMVAI